MTIFESLLQNLILNSTDAFNNEVRQEFQCYKDHKIGCSIGFLECRLDYTLESNSKEYKLLDKIIKYSYEFHRLDENGDYVHPENENR